MKNSSNTRTSYSSIEEMMKSVPKLEIVPVKLDLIIMRESTPKDWEDRCNGVNYQYPILDAKDNYDSIMELAKEYKDGYVIHFGEDAFAQCIGLYPTKVNTIISEGHDIKGPHIWYDIEEFHYDGVDMLMFHYFEPCACMSFALIKGPKAKQLAELMALNPASFSCDEDCWSLCEESSELVHEYLKSNFNIDWR